MSVDDETRAVYDSRAADYARCFESDGPDEDLSAFMAALEPGARVLDLGCGPAAASVHMLKAGFDVIAWDASAEMVRIARDRGVDANEASFGDLVAQGEFGGIWANFSLLHAPRAEFDTHLAAISRALTPRGLFHIGAKTGEGEKRDTLGRFYTYYTRDDLVARLASAGFTPISERTGTDTGLAGTADPWITILARRNG